MQLRATRAFNPVILALIVTWLLVVIVVAATAPVRATAVSGQGTGEIADAGTGRSEAVATLPPPDTFEESPLLTLAVLGTGGVLVGGIVFARSRLTARR